MKQFRIRKRLIRIPKRLVSQEVRLRVEFVFGLPLHQSRTAIKMDLRKFLDGDASIRRKLQKKLIRRSAEFAEEKDLYSSPASPFGVERAWEDVV